MTLFELENSKWFGINPTDCTVSLHGDMNVRLKIGHGSNDIPHAKELYPYFATKGSLEPHAQLEALFVILRIHGICE